MRKPFIFLLSLALTAALFSGCGEKAPEAGGPEVKRAAVEIDEIQLRGPQAGDTIAIFDTSLGEVRAVLYPDTAPMAVENFTSLAEQGYYNGTVIYRAQAGFIAAGGDASGTGTGGTTIWNGNGFPIEYSEALRHYAGALCLSCDADAPETGCYSCFYWVAALPDSVSEEDKARLTEAGTPEGVVNAYGQAGGLPYLDYTDTVFGQVYEGMGVVDRMAGAETDENSRPLVEITVNSVTISTFEG